MAQNVKSNHSTIQGGALQTSAWPIVSLLEVCSKISDGTHHSPTIQHSEAAAGRYKYVTSKNIRPWGLDLDDIAYIDENVHREIYSRCNPELGDVLLTKDGANTGNVAINTLDEEFSLLSSVALLKLKKDIVDPRFVRYYLESPVGSKRLLGDMTGTAIRRIILRKIKETAIPVAPFDDQRRIVAEIEKQFTRLDAGVAALRRVQANLKRYRAAVLKDACEGRLVPTEAELARSEGRPFESGQQLLSRILTERRQNWQGRGQYKEPLMPNGEIQQQVPDGWFACSVGQVAECLDGSRVPINKTERAKRHGDVPYYGANGQVGWIDDYLFDEPLVLVVEDETFIGRTQAFSYMIHGKTWVNNHAHVLRATGAISTAYLNYSLAYYPFTARTTGSTGRRKLTQQGLMSAPYLLPPLAEQTRIVAELERRLSVVEELEAVVSANLQRAVRMKQSILQKAFQGSLL